MATIKMEASSATVQWGFLDGRRQPVSHVRSGDTLVVRTVSGSQELNTPKELLPAELVEIFERVTERGPGPHILTGPAWVEGAAPGDTLVVDIKSMDLWVPYGFNYSTPLKGIFPYALQECEEQLIYYNQERNAAQIGAKVMLPLRPFFGILSVAPPASWGKISSVPPGRYGGNMDNRELISGTRLFLPVMQEGALFVAGDGHAAQGDGEINVTAIETCLDGEFVLNVQKNTEQQWPYAIKDNYLIGMGFDESLETALKSCASQIIQLLRAEYNFSYVEAYRLCSLAVSFRITQAVNGVKGVHGILDLRIISGATRTIPEQGEEISHVVSRG